MDGAEPDLHTVLRQALVAKHDRLIGNDDPIMMLPTVFEVLLKHAEERQDGLLRAFREEMESFALTFQDDQRKLAERVLTKAVAQGKDALSSHAASITTSAAPPARAPAVNAKDSRTALLLVCAGLLGSVIGYAAALAVNAI